MEDLQNTSTEGAQTSTEGKTFTQEDVNRIVQERLAKERSKAAGNGDDELSKRAAELDMRERKLNAREALKKEGLPDYLVDALNMSTEEDFQKSMEAIKKLKGESPAIGGVSMGTFNPIGKVVKDSRYDALRDAFGLR